MSWQSDPAKGCGLVLLILAVVAVFLVAWALAWAWSMLV